MGGKIKFFKLLGRIFILTFLLVFSGLVGSKVYAAPNSPVFIREAETVWNSSQSPRTTAAFNVLAGDVLVAFSAVEDFYTGNINVSGGSLVWTQQQFVNVSGFSEVAVWTATVNVNKSMSVTFSESSAISGKWGGNVLTFRNSSGVGSSAKANVSSGAPSLSLTTTQPGSAIVVVNADWTALDGVSRAWRTNAGVLTEQTYAKVPGAQTIYGGFHADAGSVGTYPVGLTAPAGQKYSIVAVEVKGLATSDATPPAVSITSPLEGSTVSGTIAVSANASDNIAVAGVQFLLDGANLGAEDTNTPYSINWNSGLVSDGVHVVSAVARDSSNNTATSTVINFSVQNADVTPPTVSITSPTDSSTVSGTINITATATDNVGVVGVQFLLNGANLGAEDTTLPYSVSWNTTTSTNGNYTLSARVRDGGSNSTTSVPVSVNVDNSDIRATIGEWTAPFSMPLVAIHLALLPNGKVLMFDSQDFNSQPPIVWDPENGSITNTPQTSTDLFCSGHSTLSDGKVLVVGGDTHTTGLGVDDVNAFDFATQTWSQMAKMNFRRWYATATTLADSRVFVMSGYEDGISPSELVGTHEIYNPITNVWTRVPASGNYTVPSYPFNFVLPDGRLLNAGSYEGTIDTRVFNFNTNTWSVVDPTLINAGSAVMYEPGKVMKAGMWANADAPYSSAHNNTYVMDANVSTPVWRQTTGMNFPRAYLVLTLLPDGSTAVTGGSRSTDPGNNAQAVLEAEVWSPQTETWSTMAAMQNSRLYHGTAMLLPDGRILVAGSGRYGSTERFNGEVFSPPYLFKGPRPVLSSTPSFVSHGSQFFVATPDGASISKVSLIRTGSMTHSFNADQRFISLNFAQAAGGLNITAPLNANIAPPGYYLLFIVNSNGVPSVGQFVRLPATTEDSQAPTTPTNLQASGGLGTANLTWSASTDNVGVINYNVHRSNIAGFSVATSNRIGQPVTASYNDTGLSAGTYYYKVTAQDSAGNMSGASNEATAVVTADANAPSVNMTAPSGGATVSSTVTVSANASDDIGVAGVQFLLDGANLGAEDTTIPYEISWNTFTAPNGGHSLSARARDTGGNLTTSTAVTVTVSNTTVLAIDQVSPPRVQGSDPITTAQFNPPDNSLLLVMISSDAALGGDPAVSISNNGAALTWTEIQARSIADSGGLDGEASAYYTLLPTGRTGMSVTATITNQAQSLSMKVYVITGHDTTAPIGASGEGSSATNNITPTIYTATTANSLGFAVANDWNASGLPTSTDEEDVFHIPGLISGLSAYKATPSATVGAPVTMNFDASGTGALKWNWVGFEVKPAVGP